MLSFSIKAGLYNSNSHQKLPDHKIILMLYEKHDRGFPHGN
jgi:hypothetical protein